MGKIRKINFYYGAILTAILQNNPDASPTLILNDEETRQAYKVLTNTSNQESILFLKYARSKQKNDVDENKHYTSWLFSFTPDDKEKLKTYYEKTGLPVFICLLCLRDNLNNSEIAILKYEEYKMVLQNQTVTIGLEQGKHNFYLFLGNSKSKSSVYKIPTTRINKRFDELARESIQSNREHFRIVSNSRNKIQENDLVTKELSEYPNSSECPICNDLLENIKISDGREDIDAKRCMKCGNVFLSQKKYKTICKRLGVNHLKENVLLMDLEFNSYDSKKNEKKIEPLLTNVNTIFAIERENNVCPIHRTKFQTKVINLGKRKRDTVLYCNQCKKMIIGQEHKKSFEKLMNSQKYFPKYNFEFLNIE